MSETKQKRWHNPGFSVDASLRRFASASHSKCWVYKCKHSKCRLWTKSI